MDAVLVGRSAGVSGVIIFLDWGFVDVDFAVELLETFPNCGDDAGFIFLDEFVVEES